MDKTVRSSRSPQGDSFCMASVDGKIHSPWGLAIWLRLLFPDLIGKELCVFLGEIFQKCKTDEVVGYAY